MFEEIKDRLSDLDVFEAKSAYEISDIRASMVKFLISALFLEGVVCTLGGFLISSSLLSILGGVNVTVASMSYLFRAWLK